MIDTEKLTKSVISSNITNPLNISSLSILPFISHYTVEYKATRSENEPPHDKTINVAVRPVWSKSSLSAWRTFGALDTHWAHSEDSDQIGWMPRLIWVFAGCTLILLVCHVAAQIICIFDCHKNDKQTCADNMDKKRSCQVLYTVWLLLLNNS